MSSPLAIAAVTAVLRDLLNNGVVQHDLAVVVGTVQVTAKPPDMITAGPNEAPQLNLFMYQATPNQGWRNHGLPSRDADGARLTNPPLALDLHYLLSAYGGDDFSQEILLGYAMHILHETPGLSREAIREALRPPSPVSGGILPPGLAALVAADLADQVEVVKIVPEPLSVDELSKLWSTFEAPYRATAGYKASVVLIESTRATRSALPVLRYRSYVLPLVRPWIAAVGSNTAPGTDSRITATSTIVISGADLAGPVTRVRLNDFFVPGPDLTVSSERISFPLAGISGLRAGVIGLQVVHEVLMGEPDPGVPHRGVESNVVAFVLQPAITVPATVPLAGGVLTVGFTPAAGRAQRVTLYLHEHNASATEGGPPARAYSFPAPRDNGILDSATETASIAFPIANIVPGDYLAFVQVDGAESLLGLDGAGQFASPLVQIT